MPNYKAMLDGYNTGLASAQANLTQAMEDVERWKAQVAAQRGAISAVEVMMKEQAAEDEAPQFIDAEAGEVLTTLSGKKVVNRG